MSAAIQSASAPEAGRVDQLLVTSGLCSSRTRAAKAIAAGRVSVDGLVVTRASLAVKPGSELSLTGDEADRYVGRAAHKLIGALETFTSVVVQDALCLDAGASTGGFTQVLLERGARRVIAVDVGHGQLHPTLSADPRVENHEGVNVRQLTEDFVPGGVDLVVGDLSFISLRLVVGPLANVTRPGGQMILMVKPQFEIGRERLARTGVVTHAGSRKVAVEGVVDAALRAGLTLEEVSRSSLPGQDGNAEFFLRLSVPTRPHTEHFSTASEQIAATLAAVDYS
ncbi:TlyA family RNA methyltransferase [Galactobacter caseinivorans]|uniref:TlyA family RNA methyltransferase n=1 Tax=Galactobacter caseinivorans TaxID=2676123 RepID=A0A496PK91_9MICC|nr:TlyA family RNA methyltransferase [Galactobacter caseinivorans]RKW70924.1 TlyA family RNA methyltransferase [Galactobacter caseinivorans]